MEDESKLKDKILVGPIEEAMPIWPFKVLKSLLRSNPARRIKF